MELGFIDPAELGGYDEKLFLKRLGITYPTYGNGDPMPVDVLFRRLIPQEWLRA